MADAISIEETNKVRVALGLQPLPVPGAGPTFKEVDSSESEEEQGSTLESREAAGYENWKKLQDEAEAKKKRDARNTAIRKARDEAQRLAKLEGRGLGEADEDEELDTKAWLLKQKKRQKKVEKERERVRRIEQELRDREEREYTSKDLAGVKVAHEAGDFDMEGGEQVLTLKDTTIGENEEEGDELENIQLVEKDKRDERLNLKKKPGYNPAQLVDEDQGGVLQQYDEVIDGKKRKRFVLDGEGFSAEKQDAAEAATAMKRKRQPIDLDILKDLPVSDYQEAKEVKVKKHKQKKSKSKRQKVVDEDDVFPVTTTNGTKTNGDSMEVDSGAKAPASKPKGNASFVDDEDLQASLARQRREALKKRKKLKPEDLARQIREEASAGPEVDMNDDPVDEGGLVIDETSEFVSNLQRPEPQKPRQASTAKTKEEIKPSVESPAADEDEDVDMEKSYNEVNDPDEAAAGVKREGNTPAADITENGLDSETTLTTGIGSALNLLTQRGILKRSEDANSNERLRNSIHFQKVMEERHNAAEYRARAQRERDRASGKLDRMSAREREEYARWENRQRDQAESRQVAEIFNREYKPDVQLKYVDEFGRHMNPKEAFKHLSHQFHGKGSGKQKTEKLLKKIDDEKKKDAQSVLDSSSGAGMSNAQSATSKKNKQAAVRLA